MVGHLARARVPPVCHLHTRSDGGDAVCRGELVISVDDVQLSHVAN